MDEALQIAINRLREDLDKLESLDSSYWNKSLGVSHLKTMAKVIKNDASSLAEFLINF